MCSTEGRDRSTPDKEKAIAPGKNKAIQPTQNKAIKPDSQKRSASSEKAKGS